MEDEIECSVELLEPQPRDEEKDEEEWHTWVVDDDWPSHWGAASCGVP